MGALVFMAMPVALPFGILAITAVIFVIWRRDERLRGQREMLRRAYELGEEILGASSADQILDKVSVVVPRIFGVTSAELYLYNRHAKTLDAVDRSGAEHDFHTALRAPAGPASRRGSLLPLPHPAGDSRYFPQPVSSDGTAWPEGTPSAAVAAVRSHAGARRSAGHSADGSARPRPGFQPR